MNEQVDKSQWPQWLKDANTENAIVEIGLHGRVIWRGGVWRYGVWRDGLWQDGVWRGGLWRGGVWQGGVWCGGVWEGGVWRDDKIDRLLFMASMVGCVFDAKGRARLYRTTKANGHGCFNGAFVQREGRIDVEHKPAGNGTCVAGLHATSQARALTYFGIDPTARLWEIEFDRDDLLDCDGEKARLRGGWCREINWPFYHPERTQEEANHE